MDAVARIEHCLGRTLDRVAAPSGPPLLAAAMNYAVFPRGARIRPRLCLAVASACGEDDPAIADAAAVSIELLHCASLVHDDLPCFDNADTRRGRPSVHCAYGEPLAVLAGDALIVLAFETLAAAAERPQRLAALLRAVALAVGAPEGIVAGQAWESEPTIDLRRYQQAKTGALFAAAAACGAIAAGADPAPWRRVGEALGEAYQIADDLRDVLADEVEMGKPGGRDAALGRPNAVAQAGVEATVLGLRDLVARASAAIPACPGAADLRALIALEVGRLMPRGLSRSAA